MKVRNRSVVKLLLGLVLLTTCIVSNSHAQQQGSVVPTLVNFSGILTDASGKPLSGTMGVTFLLYKDQQGGSPLWMETQNVHPDKAGHYTVALGSSTSQGLPAGLFTSGEARWLGVQPQGQAEQPRVLLLSVPYALKAGDAQTVGGLPPSAFVLAPPAKSDSSATLSSSSNSSSNSPPLGGTGTTDYLPIWTNSTTLGNSVLFQAGAGAKAKVGIGTTKPASTLDVKGGGTIRGLFSMPATGTATASGGFNSQPMDLVTSAFNSGTSTAVPQTFQWQAEPVGNNTKNASGSLNLLFSQGNGKPAETGLNIASNGQISFAKGQTFPGTGNGTITGVTAGTGLTGGGNSGNVTLNVDTTKVVTAVTAGTDLTGGGTGGNLTLNLDTTKVPQLSGNNSFTGNQTVSGTVTATSFSGNGVSITNVNASQLGGLAASAFAQLPSANMFTNNNVISVNSSNTALQVINAGGGDALDVFPSNGGIGIYTTGGQTGVYATGGTTPVIGTGGSASGVYGDSSADSNFAAGVIGFENSTADNKTMGVLGETASSFGAGVYGQNQATQSNTGSGANLGAGVWGDGGTRVGVLGTTDNAIAGVFEDNSSGLWTLYAWNYDSGGFPFVAGSSSGNSCDIDYQGNLNCTGAKHAVVLIDGGKRKVALSAIESPKNWFEDFGSEQLSNGVAVIALDGDFAQTVNTELDYHVFLTPSGDCRGLYVAQKSPTSFEVRELKGGTSNIRFDYRIVALRKNFENIRLEDHTHDPDPNVFAKRGTPTHSDIHKLMPPKREVQLARPRAQWQVAQPVKQIRNH